MVHLADNDKKCIVWVFPLENIKFGMKFETSIIQNRQCITIICGWIIIPHQPMYEPLI